MELVKAISSLNKMDIGREVKRIEGNQYSIRLFFKTNKEIKYKTKAEIGKVYLTNIDEKGRIYLPKEFEKSKLIYKHAGWGFVTLSAFGQIILFRRVEPKDVLDRIRKKPDTKIGVCISDRSEKIVKKASVRKTYKIELRHYLSTVALKPEWTLKHEKFDVVWEGFKIKMFDIHKPEIYIKRNRITIPRFFLNYIGINIKNISREEIILFELKDEIEIWEKNNWLKNADTTKWLSKEARFIFHDKKIAIRKSPESFLIFKELKFVNGLFRQIDRMNMNDFILID